MADRVNELHFVDIPVSDTRAAHDFYAELFDWPINPRPEGIFHQVVPGNGTKHLGIYLREHQLPNPTPIENPPAQGLGPRIYILVVGDPKDYLNKAIELGATKIFDEIFWREFSGWAAGFYDPWGNQIVVWENLGNRAERLGYDNEDDIPRGPEVQY
jgi:predicted enzyme related to lactoylglutathione lyase